ACKGDPNLLKIIGDDHMRQSLTYIFTNNINVVFCGNAYDENTIFNALIETVDTFSRNSDKYIRNSCFHGYNSYYFRDTILKTLKCKRYKLTENVLSYHFNITTDTPFTIELDDVIGILIDVSKYL